MGIRVFHRSSSCSSCTPETGARTSIPAPTPNNPNPRNFIIERFEDHGGWTLVLARYPDATNYEGRKILVYRHPAEVIRSSTVLDPYFCDSPGCVSPFARFEPTEAGWLAAYIMIKSAKPCAGILDGNGTG